MTAPLLRASAVTKAYTKRQGLGRRQSTTVLADVDLAVAPREIVGLVGESGSGKTTFVRSLVRLVETDAGLIEFDGVDVQRCGPRDLRDVRRRMQLVYQDPYSSLNPRFTVGQSIVEPALVHGLVTKSSAEERVAELLASVGLPRAVAQRYPRQLSGGQRQRVAIARALACEPEFLLADEAVSALDVSVQAQILNLLMGLCRERDLGMIFVSHQLAVVAQLVDRVAIMYRGRIVEAGTVADVFESPTHPYTQRLLASHPHLDATTPRVPRSVDVSPPAVDAVGCGFRNSCPLAIPHCAATTPRLTPISAGHDVACLVNAASSGSAVRRSRSD